MRVSVPGCHATGFILAIQPLVAEGVILKDDAMTCYSLTGYSGGGKRKSDLFTTLCALLLMKCFNVFFSF
ncbi:hypothetical protein [Paenibacillus chungangensis]|uniref:N-acetyl-gamma-glutamyl-phosphate reductase dimerisation domain-containing protein n=1 Tax=Paenibacillus chungangensis TaxID=696535 RepID=A0ABW3HU58_9BACL